MSLIPLSKDIFSRLIPYPALDDLTSSSQDKDNDIDYLLHWLQPFHPAPNAAFIEPSPRVKSAIRSCLKDEISQMDFVKLYINSVNQNFNNCFSIRQSELGECIRLIISIQDYYNSYLKYLNLSKLPKDLFTRNLNTLFYNELVSSDILDKLKEFLTESLFKRKKETKYMTEVLKVLMSVNLSNEINNMVIELSINKIKEFVIKNCSNVWDKPLLYKINSFIEVDMYPTFNILVKLSNDSSSYLNDLTKIAHDELVSLRINEIYKIILDYPNSEPSLYEVHECLSFNYTQGSQVESGTHFGDNSEYSNFKGANSLNYSLNSQSYQRKKLVDSFIEICHESLLHSGANTIDVITTYIKTIRSFLIIDPKGVLLDKVVRPIRRYLKIRDDIVIKLVHGLLDDTESNELIGLAKELRKSGNQEQKKKNIITDELLDINWTPDPIDALPDFKKGKVTDIIESLISIFESKDIFINEFTKLFGDKLINLHNYNVKEIEDHLDLLKLRFGKNEFSALDIMIRDVKESNVINGVLNSISPKQDINFHSTILSHLYWPTVMNNISSENDYFELPEIAKRAFDNYNNKFTNLKKGRYLKLVPHIGLVTIELDINKITMSFEVSPAKAAVIALFNNIDHELSLASVASKLKMPPYIASQCLQFWVKQNVLSEVFKDLYIVNEDNEDDFCGMADSANDLNTINSENLSLLNIGSNNKKDYSKFDELYPYIRTIITNLGPLPFLRIKNLLSITIPKENFNLQISDIELEGYLDRLVDENKLQLKNDLYGL